MTLPRRPYLTTRAHEAFSHAHDYAHGRGESDITPTHLLIGVLREGRNLAVDALLERGLNLSELEADLEAELPASGSPRDSAPEFHWTVVDGSFIEKARVEAGELGTEFYGCEHLLLAILRDESSIPARVFIRHGVRYSELKTGLARIFQPGREP